MVWKGGPKSSRSYKMDMYRSSNEPWEKKTKGWRKQHYRRKKNGYSTVQGHRIRTRRR